MIELLMRVEDVVKGMSGAQRMKMLRDVVACMNERCDTEEIAEFLIKQLDGDALEIAEAYAERVRSNWLKNYEVAGDRRNS
jgi:hypothetical protein